ncbi:MAG: MATE family efflux transporter [Firmicutes bacterium]|jgi:putative MATE family efflux protein|nr:MATE family efflux transporter [Bacillota bacterium]
MKNDFLKQLLHIALPIAIQSLITSSLNMVDTIMIGRLGDSEIAAVGICNQVYFLFMLLIFGGYSGASIFLSQYFGVKDIKNIRRVLGIMMTFGCAVAVLFTIGSLGFTKGIIGLFSTDKEVLGFGVSYLSILSICYLASALSFAFSFSSRSIRMTKIPMYVSAVALSINTILNFMLIYGKFGMPMLGVRGAAIATVIARILELVFIVIIIYRMDDHPLKAKFSELRDYDFKYFLNIAKTAVPVLLNEGTWALGMVVYFIAYGKLGKEAIASVQIANTIMNFFTVVFMALSNSASVMIGNMIGANKFDIAIDYSRRFLIMSAKWAIGIAVGLYASSRLILSFFKISQITYDNARSILIVMAIFMLPKMFNWVMVVGVLRSGGDTRFTLILDLAGVWLVGVPLAFLGAFMGLPIYYVVALSYFEEFLKMFVSIPRYRSKKWINNLIET